MNELKYFKIKYFKFTIESLFIALYTKYKNQLNITYHYKL